MFGKFIKKNLYIFLFVLQLFSAKAQNPIIDLFERMDSLRMVKLEMGRAMFTPFIAPSYTPETEFMISGGGLLSFKVQPKNKKLERSTVPFSVGYSTNKALLVNVRTNIYGYEDIFRLLGEVWVRQMPDHYWGVGYNNGSKVVRSDSTTLYQRGYWRVFQKALFRLRPYFYLGPGIDFNRTKASNLNPRMQNDPDVLRDSTFNRNMGFGLTLAYDSRDFGLNAYRGILVDFTVTNYFKILGGQNKYSTLEFDFRAYLPVWRQRRTLAFQLKMRDAFGDVPWPELSQVGSPFDLRGYYWGRYRDKFMTFFLAEYRHMFQRARPNKRGSLDSAHGFVLWLGAGTIAPSISYSKRWLPNFGAGYRLEIQPRMNFRFDAGFGTNSFSIYFTFSEAF